MRKVAVKVQPTLEEVRAALWVRINNKPAYIMPDICRHGFARGEDDPTRQGCVSGCN